MKTNKEIKAQGKELFKQNQWESVGVSVVGLAMECAAPVIIGGPANAGMAKYFVKKARGEEAKFTTVFDGFTNGQFGKNFITYLLGMIYLCLWSMLCSIVGIIKVLAYGMTFYIMQDTDLQGNAAITASRFLMKGHKWEFFCLILRFFGWAILSCFTFGILAILYVNPWMEFTGAVYYEELKAQRKEEFIAKVQEMKGEFRGAVKEAVAEKVEEIIAENN